MLACLTKMYLLQNRDYFQNMPMFLIHVYTTLCQSTIYYTTGIDVQTACIFHCFPLVLIIKFHTNPLLHLINHNTI